MTDRSQDISGLYDEHQKLDPGGEKSSEAMETIIPQVIDIIRDDPRDFEAEARAAIRAVIIPMRTKRANSLRKDLEWFLDSFEEDGAYLDPLFDLAYPLGRADGMDKTLRFWTPEDFENLVITRYRVAAESTKAAAELDETASRVIERMRATGAGTFGDVAWK